ncbi:Gfo/Idh/MocA family oxidoreductase [Flavobacteriaceae bacterium]|nr:Gfo/Idh/MocA family oxidoreductase [Flavobacteriaceae bacterium]
MNVLIIGLGSIALKHIKILKEINANTSIFALRSSKLSVNMSGVKDLFEWEEVVLKKFHFCIISSPSSLHLSHIKLVEVLRIPIFIEKPLFINRSQINDFKILDLKNLRSYVACNFRFNPIIEFLKDDLNIKAKNIYEVTAYCGSYLPNWRPNKDYRKVYSSIKELGGGVNIDLIHEPDYFVHLFGLPEHTSVHNRKVSSLEINSNDSSIIYLSYKNFQASITLNYFRKDARRTLEIVTDEKTIFVDFLKGIVKDLETNTILYQSSEDLIESSYKKQMLFFLNSIKSNEYKMNSIDEALSVLNIIV